MTVSASIFPGPTGELPDLFVQAVKKLESEIGRPVWLLVQKFGEHPLGDIDEPVRRELFLRRDEIRQCKDLALVIDSPGGQARSAYQIARLFQRHCGSFTAIVPRYAKSAATLLVLGAKEIVMGHDAEVGPLDVQILDMQAEEYGSALDEVQALERLNSAAMDQIDQTMFLLAARTRKKIDTLLPLVMTFVSDMMSPLLYKIDTVHYTQRSRALKVAEDYAIRLLRPYSPGAEAERIARELVNSYPEHGFAIDRAELSELMQREVLGPDDGYSALDELETVLTEHNILAIGQLIEQDDEEPHHENETTTNLAGSGAEPERSNRAPE